MSNPYIPDIVLTGTPGPQIGEISLSWVLSDTQSTPVSWYGFIFTVRNITTNTDVIVSATRDVTATSRRLTTDVNSQPLTPGHTYSISVHIRLNGGDVGNESNTVTVIAGVEAPPAPQLLSALPGPAAGEVRLSWIIGSSWPTITNYIINAIPVGGNAFPITTPDDQTSISLSSQLTPGTTYTFTVRSFAFIQGEPSNPVEATSPLAPNMPTSVTATPGGQVNEVTLTWDFAPITGAPITGFQIKITAPGITDVLHDINDVSSRFVTLGEQSSVTLNPTVSYVFYLKTIGTYVNSAFSIGATATPASANQFPNTPTNVVATSGPEFGQVRLTWDILEKTTAPISGYTIIVSPVISGSSFAVNTNTNTNSKVLSTTNGLSAGNSYNFVVYAIATFGLSSGGSNPPTPGTAAAVSKPYNVSATSGPANGEVTLTWDISGNIQNIVGYTIVIYTATTDVEITTSPIILNNTTRIKVLNASNGLIAGINYKFGVIANSLTASGPISPYVTAFAFGRTVPCYVKGTMILTDKGYIKIEDIKKGDKVVREGCISKRGVLEKNKIKEVPVTWVNKFKIETLDSLSRPICIAKNAFGEDHPFENLYVSPGHSIIIDDRLSTAKNLRNGETIYPYDECESVEYYHVQCETHSAIYANGILSETYIEWRKEFFNEIDYLK